MLHMLINIFGFIFAVFILVGIHEFGHFIVARFCNVKVMRFSIGFGKPLWRWYDKRGTEYVLAAIPLGGYVKLLDAREGKVIPAEQHLSFDKKSVYQRFAILAAGPLMNVVFAIFAYWLVFSMGIVQVKPVIGTVLPDSIAAQAGLKTGDEIITVADKKTSNWSAVAMQLLQQYGATSTLKITVHPTTMPAQIRTINLNVEAWHLDSLRPDLLKSLGFKPYRPKELLDVNGKPQWPAELLIKTQYPPWYALGPAIQATFNLAKLNLLIFYKLITGVISWQSLGGPFSIFQSAAMAANQGVVVYVSFLAFFSISIAIVNLLPIPGLDGSQLVYVFAEWITRRPVSVAFQLLAFRLGLILLLIFFTQLLINDFARLWMTN